IPIPLHIPYIIDQWWGHTTHNPKFVLENESRMLMTLLPGCTCCPQETPVFSIPGIPRIGPVFVGIPGPTSDDPHAIFIYYRGEPYPFMPGSSSRFLTPVLPVRTAPHVVVSGIFRI